MIKIVSTKKKLKLKLNIKKSILKDPTQKYKQKGNQTISKKKHAL